MDRAFHRVGATGTGRVTLHQAISRQRTYFADLFPIGGWLVVPLAALGLFNRRTRLPVAASLGTVLAYAALFKNGASDHGYWLYCVLLPAVLGMAAAADGVARAASRHRLALVAVIAVGAAVMSALGVTLSRRSAEEEQRVRGVMIGSQAAALKWPSDQRFAYHMFGGSGRTDLLPWLLYYSRREPFGVGGPRSIPSNEVVLGLEGERLVLLPGTKPPTGR